MKTISIAGNIGKDAEIRTAGQDKVTGWSVAVEERAGQEKRTIWFDCSLWGKRGEVLAQYLTKGQKVAVSGELSTREHNGKTYLTIRANEVTLLGGRQEGGERPAPRGNDGYGAGGRPSGRSNDFDDEIPFAPQIL